MAICGICGQKPWDGHMHEESGPVARAFFDGREFITTVDAIDGWNCPHCDANFKLFLALLHIQELHDSCLSCKAEDLLIRHILKEQHRVDTVGHVES